MAGFLDSKERIIDTVLTDVGKSLLLKGDLHFTYWVAFDNEVDYDPPIAGAWIGGNFVPSASLSPSEKKSLQTGLTEDPLIREATMGYRGLNFTEEDTTNVHRPMYSAPLGVGQTYPMLTARVTVGTGTISGSEERFSGSMTISVQQQKRSKSYVQQNDQGQDVVRSSGSQDVTFVRTAAGQSTLLAEYPEDKNQLGNMQMEGFLATVYLVSVSGSQSIFTEILHNRDSKGNIVYRNDLALDNLNPLTS